jgi:hypothetical protein
MSIDESMEKLYHGTTMPYLVRMVKKYGHYEHEFGKPIYLSKSIGDAQRKALEFSEKFQAQPVVLIIDPNGISGLDYESDMWPRCNYINTDYDDKSDRFVYLDVLTAE